MRRTIINDNNIRTRTEQQKHAVRITKRRADHFRNDPEQKLRQKKAECLVCYYMHRRIGGSKCTQAQCALCNKVIHSPNTDVDMLCLECARHTGLCKRCGADMELKHRRTRQIPEATPDLEERRENE